ncbi:hypothetical protein J2852_004847 [Azospirillum soli]|nr:hypothetical protein [Azospirillum soli]MBP2315489.1 hypothetical protein [Azospirillum soli]
MLAIEGDAARVAAKGQVGYVPAEIIMSPDAFKKKLAAETSSAEQRVRQALKDGRARAGAGNQGGSTDAAGGNGQGRAAMAAQPAQITQGMRDQRSQGVHAACMEMTGRKYRALCSVGSPKRVDGQSVLLRLPGANRWPTMFAGLMWCSLTNHLSSSMLLASCAGVLPCPDRATCSMPML